MSKTIKPSAILVAHCYFCIATQSVEYKSYEQYYQNVKNV